MQAHRTDPSRVYIVRYEALMADFLSEIAPLAKFLGKPLSAKQRRVINRRCRYQAIRRFFKTTMGDVGLWINHFSHEQANHFDEIYNERMKDTGWPFYFATLV